MLSNIKTAFANAFLLSSIPMLFGSIARRKGKQAIANQYFDMANKTAAQISNIRSQNPYESAAAKAALERASSGAKAMQTRFLNTMGSNASPEALIAAQGAANQSMGSAVGQIAVGAEANRDAQVNNLSNLQTQQMGMGGSMSASAESERGSGWSTLFQGINALGSLASGGGQAAQVLGLGSKKQGTGV